MLRLQQTPTCGPFPREFISLAQIASRAGQYKITHIIGRDIRASHTDQGVCVFNMEDILPVLLFKLRMTTRCIITAILLSLQLLLNLGISISPSDSELANSTCRRISNILLFVCYICFVIGCPIVFRVQHSISLLIRQTLLPMPAIGLSRTCIPLVTVTRLSSSIPIKQPLMVIDAIGSLLAVYLLLSLFTIFCQTILTCRIQAIFPCFVNTEYFGILGKPSLAPGTFLFILSMFLRCCNNTKVRSFAFAFLAAWNQSHCIARASMKICRRCGEPLLAIFTLLQRGILGYTLTHGRNQSFLSSRLGVLQHRSGSTLLPLHYSITPPVKQVYATFTRRG